MFNLDDAELYLGQVRQFPTFIHTNYIKTVFETLKNKIKEAPLVAFGFKTRE